MKTIKKIEAKAPLLKERKKVAAYARVSMQTERMNHSLSAQVSYYSALIQKNPDWEYAGVYADDFISGTGTVKRDEFRRMLEDCEAGKIHLILTKSISRFARNTVDLLETVRHLKDIGVEVWFEKENIHSFDGDGELMMSILASFAQAESESISNNVKWAIRKRMAEGTPNFRNSIIGYEWVGDELVVVPEEAKIVKRIFQNFIDGKSRLETEREFAAEGITTKSGCRWVDSNIKVVLTNCTYTGDLLMQKEFIQDPITKKRRKNRGELPQYLIRDHHEAIIDRETFDWVQDEMERRRELGALANKSLNTCCFTGKIKCPYCGVSYMHEHRTKNGNYQEFWVCGSRKKKKVGEGCPVGGTISHKSLIRACTEILGLEEFDEEVFLEKVEYMNVPERYVLEFHMRDGRVIRKDCPNTGHKDCWTAEYRAKASKERRSNPRAKNTTALTGKIKCGDCGGNYSHALQPVSWSKTEKVCYWRCRGGTARGCKCIGLREEWLQEQITEILKLAEYSEDAVKKRIDFIRVHDVDMIDFHLKDGDMITVKYMPPKSHKPHYTEESRKKRSESLKAAWTPERRKAMSEFAKEMRRREKECRQKM